MKRIGEIRNLGVYENDKIFFIETTTNQIVLGKYFKDLSKESQGLLLNRSLLAIEYVNLCNKKSSIEVEGNIDIFMKNKGYSIEVISMTLKEMYKLLQVKARLNKDFASIELNNLSERYLDLKNNQRISANY